MKKMILVMALLAMAVPAMADVNDVTVTITDIGGGVAQIGYTSDVNVAAFGIDIIVIGATITAVDANMAGESTAAKRGFGIFPASFDAYIDPGNPDWDNVNYTPLAKVGSTGALGGLGTTGVTLEMGTLYEDGNEPAKTGVLGTFTVSGTCTASVTVNGSNGGIVLRGGEPAITAGLLATNRPVAGLLPLPGQATVPNPSDTATDVSVTNDLSWTAGSDATAHIVYFGTTSPGDSQREQSGTTFDTSTMANNQTYYWRIDEKNATGTTTGTVWSFTTEAAAGWSYPACWDDGAQCKGDFSGDGTVNATDFMALKNSYGKSYPDGDYNPCADSDRNGTVNATDFMALKNNYGTNPVADCVAGDDAYEVYKP